MKKRTPKPPKLVPEITPIHADIDSFPACCGALIVKDLDEDTLGGEKTPQTRLNNEHLYRLENLEPKARSGAYFATTIPSQRDAIARLRVGGWSPLFSWRNPNTGNVITLWGISGSRRPLSHRPLRKGKK
jgi:hypothetical protein